MPFDMGSFRGGGEGPGGRPFSLEDIVTLSFFLFGATQQKVWAGGYTADDAFSAACRIMQIPEAEFRAELDRIQNGGTSS